jgi:hypothetical protein
MPKNINNKTKYPTTGSTTKYATYPWWGYQRRRKIERNRGNFCSCSKHISRKPTNSKQN